MRIYIAGPMTGLPDLNRPAFYDAATRLTLAGHEPINPATIPLRDDWQYADYLRAALRMLLDTEAVALLPGWPKSHGAQTEYNIAAALGMPVRHINSWVHA